MLVRCNKILRFHPDFTRLGMAEIAKKRPGTMRLIDATQYRLPAAGWVSILHRASGVLMFVLLPFVIWMLDTSLTSEISYGVFSSAIAHGISVFPGWFLKLVVLALIWSYLHHFIAGLRHLWMDVTHSVSKEFGTNSAVFTLAVSILLTLALGYKLFF
jgi:succinate dehydrogenase / fumarate reductase, cytochrome b subunit